MRLLRRLEQAVTSSGNRRGGIYDQSDSDEAIFDRLFRRTIRCRSTKALAANDHLSGRTVLKLLSSSTAVHLHRALREIHANILQAVNGEEDRSTIITYVKRAHRLIRNGIYICACLTDYGECRKLKFEPVDIKALIRDCLERYRFCFQPLPFKADMTGEVTLVRGNEKLLRKMVLEMIDYAVRLKPKPDQLHITVERAAEASGSSSHANASNHIKIHFCYVNQFDLANCRHQLIHPYSQMARSRPQAAMGLASSIGIANRHNGSMTISSSKEGSVLSIKLPLASALRNAFTGEQTCP
jgi:signal transduction histidine kinase